MKIVFVIVALLVCADQISSETEGEKANDPSADSHCKPSAHIEAANKKVVTYPANTVIKDWSVSAPYSHLEFGMTYNNGKLTVPVSGRYYVYAQLYYHNRGRVFVNVNGKPVTMIQPPTSGRDRGALYAGGVFKLKAGDVITLSAHYYPTSSVQIYMATYHSYFGAYMI